MTYRYAKKTPFDRPLLYERTYSLYDRLRLEDVMHDYHLQDGRGQVVPLLVSVTRLTYRQEVLVQWRLAQGYKP